MATKSAVRGAAQHKKPHDGAGIDSKVTLQVLAAVRRGRVAVRRPRDWSGSAGKVAAALNAIIESNERLEREIRRLGRHIGKEVQVQHASIGQAGGAWASTLDAVNDLVEDLGRPNSEIARVISAVANGDLSQTMPLEIDGRPLQGQFLNTAKTVNTMVGQLNAFAAEVTRVAREVGTEGKLGGQAQVRGVGGVWKDLTDNVNFMASNLTTKVRGIARVVTSVANGDLTQQLKVEAKGEIAALAETINAMTETLGVFAQQVINVARTAEVGCTQGGSAVA